MQTSILTLMLALGLPGANSCHAQSQDLPRVNQNPPAATHGHDTDADDDDADEHADDDTDNDADVEDTDLAEMDGDDESDAAQGAGTPVAIAPQGAPAAEGKPHCQGAGACTGKSAPQTTVHTQLHDLGYVNDGQLRSLTIAPFTAMVLQGQEGKPLTLNTRSQSPHAAMVLGENGEPLLRYRIAQTAPQAQQDDRVRELEKRVRELEAQLRERDGQRARSVPRSPYPQGYAGEADRELERAHAAEMRERMSTQAREYAEQARRQADELRKHADVIRKQALEQAEQWRVQQKAMAGDMHKWKMDFQQQDEPGALPQPLGGEPPVAMEPPEPMEVPEVPQAGWWATTPAPTEPKMKAPKAPKPPKAGKPGRAPMAPSPAHAQEMQAMLEQLRAQMDEMRAQMEALREELQNAPRREMR